MSSDSSASSDIQFQSDAESGILETFLFLVLRHVYLYRVLYSIGGYLTFILF